MVHRDPKTGQFVADGQSFDDIETMTFSHHFRMEAADLDGTAGGTMPQGEAFQGYQIIDLDELLDRHERAELISADHHMALMAPSTRTADGTVAASIEVSASPTQQIAGNMGPTGDNIGGDDYPLYGDGGTVDTMDLVGRPLHAITGGPFSDGASGVGGSNTGATDEVKVDDLPGGYEVDGRDELYLNGGMEVSNIADGAVVCKVTGQHHYGVLHD